MAGGRAKLEEIAYGQRQLMQNLDRIDYVITHETPFICPAFIARSEIDPDYHLPALFDAWYRLMEAAPRFKNMVLRSHAWTKALHPGSARSTAIFCRWVREAALRWA